ncbi:MAG: glycosyltransferase family 39 protein, partial [Chloroflexota bacterium]
MKHTWQLRTMVLLVTLLAAGLRFIHLGYHDLRGDEAFSVSFAQENVGAIIQQLRAGEPHPPLYYLSLKAWMEVAGTSEVAVRWLSAAAGILLVPLSFVFLRKIGTPVAGVIAALLVATNPYQIWNSQDARMYALAATASAGVLYWGLRLLTADGKPRRRDAYALAACTLFAFYTHYVLALVVAAVDLALAGRWLLRHDADGETVRHWLVGQAVAALLFLPWLGLAVGSVGPSYGGNMSSPSLGEAVAMLVQAYTSGGMLPSAQAETYAWVVGIAACLGVAAMLRRERRAAWMLIAFAAVPFAALFLASRPRPVFSDRYLIVISPALYILAARGLAPVFGARGAWRRPAPAFMSAVAGVLAVALALYGTSGLTSYFTDRGGQGPGNWRPFVASIVESVQPGDLVLVNHIDPSFFYYYRLLGGDAEATVEPSAQGLTLAKLDRELNQKAGPGRQVWFVPDAFAMWDKNGAVADWLQGHAIRLEARRVAGQEYVRYRIPGGRQTNLVFG